MQSSSRARDIAFLKAAKATFLKHPDRPAYSICSESITAANYLRTALNTGKQGAEAFDHAIARIRKEEGSK